MGDEAFRQSFVIHSVSKTRRNHSRSSFCDPPFHLPGCAPFVASSYMFARTRRNVSPDRDGFRSPRAIETGTERRYEDAKGVIDGFGWFMGAAGAIVVACYGVSHLY